MFPNRYPLQNWDEAWYGEIIKNLVSGKHGWLAPYWNGQFFFDKPPLYYWLSFFSVKLFGIGELQIRLVAVLSGLLAVLFTYLIANYLYGKKAGVISSLILISLGQIWLRFTSADLDSLQIFVFLATIYFFLISGKNKVNLFLSGIFLGLSLLVKSWLLGYFPFVFLVLYSSLINKKLIKNLYPIFLISIVVGGWWYLAGSIVYGRDFITWYLGSPDSGNLRSGVNFLNPYYFKIILADFGLWLIPLITIFLYPKEKSKFPSLIIPVCIISSLFLFFLQLSSDKFNWYLLPLYPLIAIVFAQLFSRIDLRKNTPFLFLLVLSFIGQMAFNFYIIQIDQDRSLLGAELGKFVGSKIPQGSNVILDDKDFPAFIYYSNLGHVTVASREGGKATEPWIISYQRLQSEPKPFWIVTKDWQKLNLGIPKEIITAPYHFRIVRFDTNPIKP